ncbi:glycosyl transferase [Vibrio crassostreae 9CS106]|nr:glycosyl transferase [Vibrio crassostreae 9CS106]
MKAPKSICVLRLSAIGDVCHVLSTVQLIQHTYPDCDITWVMGKVEAQLFNEIPGITVIVFDKKQGLKGMCKVWRKLKRSNFDYLLHMQVALRASILTLGIKANVKLGFSWARAKEGQWLFTNSKLAKANTTHVLDHFSDFARALGCPEQEPKWNIPIAEKDKKLAQSVATKSFIVISPAASKDERNWLVERYAKVAEHAYHRGYQVVLCGSPISREMLLAKSIVQSADVPITNLVGQTNLKQLTALLSLASLVIAPDSGPAHLATTQGTPVIGLYAHSNPNRTGPYNSLTHVVSVYEQAAELQYNKPVKELAWGSRVKGKELMSLIETSTVITMLDKVLESISLPVKNNKSNQRTS